MIQIKLNLLRVNFGVPGIEKWADPGRYYLIYSEPYIGALLCITTQFYQWLELTFLCINEYAHEIIISEMILLEFLSLHLTKCNVYFIIMDSVSSPGQAGMWEDSADIMNKHSLDPEPSIVPGIE